MKIKVAVVDDHTLLSQAIAGLVSQFANVEVVNISKHGREFIEYLEVEGGERPDLVLMDVKMPIMGGIESTAYLTKKHPKLKIIALTIEADEQIIRNMVRAGARGYLLKDVKKDVLQFAINEVMRTGYYYTKNVKKAIDNEGNDEVKLKPREIEFIQHACTEITYKEVADRMCLSPKTIEGYCETVFQKLNVKNRTGLVIYAIKNGIFEPE